MGSETYTTQAIKNLKKRMEKEGYEYNKKLSDVDYSPKQLSSSLNYRPEMDVSDHCSDSQTQFFQNLIGILRWTVELGRIDIAFEVSILSRYLAQPRTGHFVQALHIFKYLDLHKANDLAFDPAYHDVEDPELVKARISAMKDMYPDAVEDLPPNAPPPRGNPVEINCFVDSDHAGDKITRRSQTGILLYLNSAPIIWYSKRQATVESSTFGSEFVALRVASELVISLRYKLRMFGIPIVGPTTVFCDNEAVYTNATFAESTLKKKHIPIAYHQARETVADDIMLVFYEKAGSNHADLFTKVLNHIDRKRFCPIIISVGRTEKETQDFCKKYTNDEMEGNTELSKINFENYYLYRKLNYKNDIYFISVYLFSLLSSCRQLLQERASINIQIRREYQKIA